MDSITSSLPSLRFRLRVNFVSCSDVAGGGADVMNSTSPAYAATQADEPASASVTAALMPANLSLLSVRTSMHNTAVPSVRKSDHLSKNDIYLAHSNPKQKTPVLMFAAEESEDEQTKEHSPDPDLWFSVVGDSIFFLCKDQELLSVNFSFPGNS